MDKVFKFYRKVNNVDNSLNFAAWDQSVRLFGAGKFRESFEQLLKYVDTTISFPKSGDVDMKFRHGSVVLNLKITPKSYSINAPFLRVPATPAKIALMRQVLELNFSYLTISKILLKGDELFFYYEDVIENSDPSKIFFLLEEICYCADHYDDIFVEQFGAARLSEQQLDFFTQKQKDEAYQSTIKILESGLKYAEYFESKRLYADAYDSMGIALMQLDYVVAPQGPLGHLLADTLTNMKNGASQEEMVFKTKEAFKKLLAYERQKFDQCMFYPKYLIPFKKYANVVYSQDYIFPAYERVKNSLRTKNFVYASLDSFYTFYSLFWNNALQKDISSKMEKALNNSSEKPWEQAAKNMYQAMDDIMKMYTGA